MHVQAVAPDEAHQVFVITQGQVRVQAALQQDAAAAQLPGFRQLLVQGLIIQDIALGRPGGR